VDGGETGYDWYSYWSSNDYTLGATTYRSYVPWRTMYIFVKNSNDVIGSVNPEEATPEALVALGRAYAYRANAYLFLAQIYEWKAPTDPGVDPKYTPDNNIAGLTVPIVTEKTTQEEAKNNPRAPKADVYKLIMDDLDMAEELLAEEKTTGLLPSLPVVYGLKARAYLAQEKYAEAAEYADKAIVAKAGKPLTQEQWENPTTGFNDYSANSSSWMWYVAYSAETMGNLCNFVAHMSAENTWTAYGWSVARGVPRRLYESIPDTDFRKHSWIDPDGLKYYNYKTNRDVFTGSKPLPAYTSLKFRPAGGDCNTYKVGGATHVPTMRLEEMYLIKAEGLAMSGKVGDGQAVLESLIKTRDPEYSAAAYATPAELQAEVYRQKRIELWGEGLILYDAKRLGAGFTNGYTGTNAQEGYRFNCSGVAPWWTFVIPQSEINGNPALDGYNNPDPTKTVKEWTE
jgi:tetratricopeptide (TPR) repeat protein